MVGSSPVRRFLQEDTSQLKVHFEILGDHNSKEDDIAASGEYSDAVQMQKLKGLVAKLRDGVENGGLAIEYPVSKIEDQIYVSKGAESDDNELITNIQDDGENDNNNDMIIVEESEDSSTMIRDILIGVFVTVALLSMVFFTIMYSVYKKK